MQLAGHKIVLLVFYAEWCEQCKGIDQHLERWARQYSPNVIVDKVNDIF